MRVFIVALLLVAWLPAVGGVDLRPYAGPDAPLLVDLQERRLQQWLRLTVASYESKGLKNPAYDEQMVSILTHVARARAGLGNERSHEVVRKQAEALYKPKGKKVPRCRDPILAWAIWWLRDHDGSHFWHVNQACDEANKRISQDSQGGKPRHTYLMSVELTQHMLGTYGRPDPSDKKGKKWLKVLGQMAPIYRQEWQQTLVYDDWSMSPDVLVEIMDNMKFRHHVYGEAVMTGLGECSELTTLPAWAYQALLAAGHVNAAWSWRGSGWASTVTAKGWEGFRRHLAAADQCAEASWHANQNEVIVTGIGCTIAGASAATSSMETWLTRSMSACFDDLNAYRSVQNFQKPRWGGSYVHMLDLGIAMANTERFDTSVPWQLTNAVRSVIRDHRSNQPLSRQARLALARPATQTAVSQVLAAYLKDFPHQHGYYTCIQAAVEYHAELYDQAQATLASIGEDEVDHRVARWYRVDFQHIRDKVDVQTSHELRMQAQQEAEAKRSAEKKAKEAAKKAQREAEKEAKRDAAKKTKEKQNNAAQPDAGLGTEEGFDNF